MSTFTPGPWLVAKISPYEDDPASPPFCQILAGGLDSGHSFEVHGILPEADARLIALAPELYEYVESSAQNGCATAQALIAKTRGDQVSA